MKRLSAAALFALVAFFTAGLWTPANPDAQDVRNTAEYRVAMAAYRAGHPACEWCGTRPVEVHHVLPVFYAPDRAADTNNMISLCRRDHLSLGHAGNWSRGVTNVREIVRMKLTVERER